MPRTMTLEGMRERRSAAAAEARAILDRAKDAKRDLTDDEKRQFDELIKEMTNLAQMTEREERLGREESELAAPRGNGPFEAQNRTIGGSGPADAETLDADPSGAVLTRSQSFARWAENRGILRDSRDEYRGLTFGSFVRSMVVGPKSEAERRALSEGTDSAGGYTVPINLSAQLIDSLRARSVAFTAGAMTVPLLTDKTTIARIASDPACSWKAENLEQSDSGMTFDAVEFDAQTLICLVRASRELIEDSANLGRALPNVFVRAMAAELDRAALFGSGTAPEPQGVFGTSGIGSVSMGTDGAQLSDYAKILDTIYAIEAENAGPVNALVAHPRTWTALAKLEDSTGQPLRAPDALANVARLSTTSVPIDQDQGTALDQCSTILAGNWQNLMIGMRSNVRIEVLRERYSEYLQYGFLVYMRADVQLAHAAAFAKLIGIKP